VIYWAKTVGSQKTLDAPRREKNERLVSSNRYGEVFHRIRLFSIFRKIGEYGGTVDTSRVPTREEQNV
jgi:hypothetical protein